MADENQLSFTVVFNKDTGQLVGAAQDLKKLEDATESAGKAGAKANAATASSAKAAGNATKDLGEKAVSAGKAGDDGLKKIQGRVAEVASGVLIAQLALEGFKKVAQNSEAFQGLQSTFDEISESAVNDLAPSLDLISKGLQGLALMVGGVVGLLSPILSTVTALIKGWLDIFTANIGALINLVQGNVRGAWESFKQGVADAKTEFTGLGGQFEAGFKKLQDGFSAGLDRINGKSKAFTKQRAEDLNAGLNAEIAHNDAMLAIKNSYLQADFSAQGTSSTRKLALLKYQEDLELNNLKQNENAKAQVLKNSRNAHQITEKQFQTQMASLEKQSADARLGIQTKATLQRKAIAASEKQALVAAFQETEDAFVSSVVGQIKAGADLQTALRAGAAAIISSVANQAAKVITIRGAEAAANAFASAPNPYVGAVLAAGTFAWYAGLATIVGSAGALAANAVGPPSDSASSAPSKASARSDNASQASESAGSTSSTAELSAPAEIYRPSSGGQAGSGTLTINVLLDGAPILRAVQQASFNGNLQISARAISGS